MGRMYMTGYAGSTRDETSLLSWNVWQRFDPEFARRLKMAMDDSIDAGIQCGVGGGWRSSGQQQSGFMDRHQPEDDNDLRGSIFWPHTLVTARYGKPAGTLVTHWERLPGQAPMAPPNSSYHESTTRLGHCLAVDMVGDLSRLTANAGKFGLIHFANVNGEPWHFQPAEIPRARRDYIPAKHEPLTVFGGGFVPQPPKPAVTPIVVAKPTLQMATPTMNGKEVMVLQNILIFWKWMDATTPSGKPSADGWFGQMSEDGVKRMQRALQITADGVYGPVTAAAYERFAKAMAGVR